MSRKRTQPHPAAPSPAQFARFYRVDVRTIQRWLSARRAHSPSRAQLAAPRLMLRWYGALPGAAQSRLSPQFRTRLTRLRLDLERTPTLAFDLTTPTGFAAPPTGAPPIPPPALPAPPPPITPPPTDSETDTLGFLSADESAQFDRDYDPAASSQDALKILARERAYWLKVIESAKHRRDEHTLDVATKHFITANTALLKAETAARASGLELGETLPRAAVERLTRAHIHHALRCLDHALPSLCRRALNLSFPEEARALLEPALLSAAFFEPIAHAAALATGQSLPAWLPACYADALADYLENGREQLAHRVAEILLQETHTDGAGI